MDYDLKISNATIIDGSGGPAFAGDAGVNAGRVVALGSAPGEARETIDAGGRVLCPGFVDIHTHYDAQILWDPLLSVSPWHGVTTVVMGNCGFGVAPTRPEHRALIMRTLEKVEGMSFESLTAGLTDDWPFETFPEYLDAVESRGAAINTAVLLGHTPLRTWVMGEAAAEREASEEEIAQMCSLAREALAAGALGFATSRSPTHVGHGGLPVPSRVASHEEVCSLARELGAAGRGIMQATAGPEFLFNEMEQIARETGRTLSWTALLAGIAGPGSGQAMMRKSQEMVDRGIDVVPQVSCRSLQFDFTFDEPFPFEARPEFAEISKATTTAERMGIYANPAWRERARQGIGPEHPPEFFNGLWDQMVVSSCAAEPGLEGRRVVELAAESGVDALDLVFDLSLRHELAVRFRMPFVNYDEDELGELLTADCAVLGLSDAGAHASQLCDACFSTHLLGHWVRHKGVLSLEQAVHMLTARPAEVFGLSDRGLLAEGRPADLVLFDPEKVAAGELRRVNDMPGGADRLVVDATGIDLVVVNGVIIRRDGRDTVSADDPLPGRLLRHGSAASATA